MTPYTLKPGVEVTGETTTERFIEITFDDINFKERANVKIRFDKRYLDRFERVVNAVRNAMK